MADGLLRPVIYILYFLLKWRHQFNFCPLARPPGHLPRHPCLQKRECKVRKPTDLSAPFTARPSMGRPASSVHMRPSLSLPHHRWRGRCKHHHTCIMTPCPQIASCLRRPANQGAPVCACLKEWSTRPIPPFRIFKFEKKQKRAQGRQWLFGLKRSKKY